MFELTGRQLVQMGCHLLDTSLLKQMRLNRNPRVLLALATAWRRRREGEKRDEHGEASS